MTGALFYPPADRTTQWFGNGNATVAPNKQLWHTTETAGGWPGYAGGASAPNLTYEPWQHRWRQHFPLNGTARALRNGVGYSTNRQGVCQVEVSCYCDPARFGTGKGINRLDNQAYDDMHAFAEFMRREWGVPMFTGVAFLPYPDSYGANGVRLSRAQFTAYRGHLDHMHAPDNTHGDAGTMDVPRIVAATSGDDDMTPEEHNQLARLSFGIDNGGSTPFSQQGEITDRLRVVDARLVRVEAAVTALAAKDPVDEEALAIALAPLLADQNVVVNLDDTQLAAIATSVADEQARRQQA